MNASNPDCFAARPLARLTRQDLVEHEVALRDALAEFVSFKSASLYFPQTPPPSLTNRDGAPGAPLHLPEEKKLLLPLLWDDAMLGVFVARGVRLQAPRTTLAMLPAVARILLEGAQMRKIARCDPLTGLLHEALFLETAALEIAAVGASLAPDAAADPGLETSRSRASVGMIALRLTGMRALAERQGRCFAERLTARAAEALETVRPAAVTAGRVGGLGFGLLLPDAGVSTCAELAAKALHAIAEVSLPDPITGEQVGLEAVAGYAVFPQDMEGRAFERSAAEQARVLFAKAERAAAVALSLGMREPMAYTRVLERGGRVKHTLPMNRLVVSVGASVGAQEGQRFLIWSRKGGRQGGSHYKGELILMEVSQEESLAEVMHMNDPGQTVEPGDLLTLLKGHAPSAQTAAPGDQRDAITGMLLYRDFLHHLRLAGENNTVFSLALMRLSVEGDAAEKFHNHSEQVVGEAAALARETFGEDLVGGRFSMNSLVFFHPGLTAEETLTRHRPLHKALAERGVDAAVGVAGHPCLTFKKADALENCRKALDFALLLDAPRLGVFGSLAMTISADKHFSKGDLYAAVEEYKQALLADPENVLALNSLGVCEARLGRLTEARERFEGVLARERGNLMARYNLGYVHQKLGELPQAKDQYRRCLKKDPGHLFSLVRLGQVAEYEGSLALARRYYNKAAGLEGGEGVTRRHLGRLAYKQNRLEEAREMLHQALLHDPKDAHSLHLMARIYLDAGEDPEIAKAFASQSVALRPDQRPYWTELARAFDSLGRPTEAQRSMAKASGL